MRKLFLGCCIALFCSTLSFGQADAIKDSLEVFFDLDKATLKEESTTAINANFEKYKGRLLKMRVAGHTCDIGSDNYNMGLSEKRAQAAFEFIQTLGEYQDKCELFFYGEKEQKYDEREANRRVHVLFFLEDDDRDTLIKTDCAEVFIEKRSYTPAAKNKKMNFELKYYTSAKKMKLDKLSINTADGNKLYFNSVFYFKASFNNSDLTPNKNVKIKMPLVNEHKDGFTFYTGKDQDGKIVWTNTGRPCVLSAGADCNTYDFDWTLDGYCGCAKVRKCEEDCNFNPFIGEENPDTKAADVRVSPTGTIGKFAAGTYTDLSDVVIIDDVKFDEDLDVCDQFGHAITTNDWFAARFNVINAKRNIVVKSANDPNAGNVTRIYIPKADVVGMAEPVLLSGTRHKTGKYVVWGSEVVKSTTCLGEVNCDYVIYDVPATGIYKLCEWKNASPTKPADKCILKTRVLKGSKIFVGNTATNEVYIAKNATRKGKTRVKEFTITDFENASDVVVYVQNGTKKMPMYQEYKLSELIYKKRANMYIIRLRDFKKVKDFSEVKFTKCK